MERGEMRTKIGYLVEYLKRCQHPTGNEAFLYEFEHDKIEAKKIIEEESAVLQPKRP
jgi:hypothetical protein